MPQGHENWGDGRCPRKAVRHGCRRSSNGGLPKLGSVNRISAKSGSRRFLEEEINWEAMHAN